MPRVVNELSRADASAAALLVAAVYYSQTQTIVPVGRVVSVTKRNSGRLMVVATGVHSFNLRRLLRWRMSCHNHSAFSVYVSGRNPSGRIRSIRTYYDVMGERSSYKEWMEEIWEVRISCRPAEAHRIARYILSEKYQRRIETNGFAS